MWQSTHGDLPNSCVAAAEKGSQRKLGYIVLFRHCCVRCETIWRTVDGALRPEMAVVSLQARERVQQIVILVNTLVLADTCDHATNGRLQAAS